MDITLAFRRPRELPDSLRFLYCCPIYRSESHRFAGYSRTYKRTVLHTVSFKLSVSMSSSPGALQLPMIRVSA
jgi:hypothetical protein